MAQNLLDKCGIFLPETKYTHQWAYGFDGKRGSATTLSTDGGGGIDVSCTSGGEFYVWLIVDNPSIFIAINNRTIIQYRVPDYSRRRRVGIQMAIPDGQTGRTIVIVEPDFVDVLLREDMVSHYRPSSTAIRRPVRKDVSLSGTSEAVTSIAMEERWAGESLTVGGPTLGQAEIKQKLSTLEACLLLSGFSLQIVGAWL